MIASLFSLWYISLLFLLISSALFIVSLSLSPFSPSFPPTICRQWRVCGCRQLLKHGHRRLIIDEFFCLRRQASGQPRLTHMHQDLLIHSQGPPSTHTHTHTQKFKGKQRSARAHPTTETQMKYSLNVLCVYPHVCLSSLSRQEL